MAQDIDKLLEQMRANPKNVRFADALKVATAFFGEPRRNGSHHVFKMPWAGDPRVNLQKADGAKPYQVRQLLEAVDRLAMERGSGEVVGITSGRRSKKRE